MVTLFLFVGAFIGTQRELNQFIKWKQRRWNARLKRSSIKGALRALHGLRIAQRKKNVNDLVKFLRQLNVKAVAAEWEPKKFKVTADFRLFAAACDKVGIGLYLVGYNEFYSKTEFRSKFGSIPVKQIYVFGPG